MIKLKLKLQTVVKKIFFTSIFLSFSLNVQSKMYKIETKHLVIAYEEGFEKLAIRLREKGDGIAEKVFECLGHYPSKKIIVNIRDNKMENAFITPITPEKIYIFPYSPIGAIEKNYEQWIDFVFSHELTHSVIAMMSYYPMHAFFVPGWIHEGTAVYIESKFNDNGGRGNSNSFLSKAKSYEKISLAKANRFVEGSYILGHSLIDSYAKKYGEDKLATAIRNKVNAATPLFNLGYFEELVEEKDLLTAWNESHVKQIPQGNKLNDNRVSMLDGFEDVLYFYNGKDRLNILDFNNNIDGSQTYKTIKLVKNFSFENGMSYVKYFKEIYSNPFALTTAAYVDGYYMKLNNANVLCKSKDGEVVYSSRERGLEKLISSKRGVILGEKQHLLYNKISFYKDKIVLLASSSIEPGTNIYFLEENRLVKITEALTFSIYEDKIYFTKDDEDRVEIFEYNISEDLISKVSNTFFAESPVRIKDKIYYLSLDEGHKYIYSFDMPNNREVSYRPKKEHLDITKENYEPVNIVDKKSFSPGYFYLPIVLVYNSNRFAFHNIFVEDLFASGIDAFIEYNLPNILSNDYFSSTEKHEYKLAYGVKYSGAYFDVMLGKDVFKNGIIELSIGNTNFIVDYFDVKYDEDKLKDNSFDYAVRLKGELNYYQIGATNKMFIVFNSLNTIKLEGTSSIDFLSIDASYKYNVDTEDSFLRLYTEIYDCLRAGINIKGKEFEFPISSINTSKANSDHLHILLFDDYTLYDISHKFEKNIEIMKGFRRGVFVCTNFNLSFINTIYFTGNDKKFSVVNPKDDIFSYNFYENKKDENLNYVFTSKVKASLGFLIADILPLEPYVEYMFVYHEKAQSHHLFFGI